MMNRMHQQLTPQQIANAPEFAISISDLSRPVVRRKPGPLWTTASSCTTRNAGCERYYRSRAFDVWRFVCFEFEFALIDP